MTYVDHIKAAFGGIRPMARAIGVPHTTVQSWCDRGSIPAGRQGEVLSAAKASGISLANVFPEDPAE